MNHGRSEECRLIGKSGCNDCRTIEYGEIDSAFVQAATPRRIVNVYSGKCDQRDEYNGASEGIRKATAISE